MIKKSITLHGHRTSLSLEPEFWEALEIISQHNHQSIHAFIEQIDDLRTRTLQNSLASRVRIEILKWFINKTKKDLTL